MTRKHVSFAKTAAAALVATAFGTNLLGDDLPWKFDASTRPADSTAVSAECAAPAAVPLCVAAAGDALGLFDTRLGYTLVSEGHTLYVPRLFYIFLR